MQLQTKENIKTSLDIGGARQFKLKLTAKTFKILANLYNDKIRAIIREISCNAQDAHIAAGKPEEPIEVWLPTSREPYFKVKDTGLGITEEDMYEIYTNVGESTKEDCNDQTGALGLGTKSPLYYADAFTIESIKDGNKKIYTCFLQDGYPTILKLPSYDEAGNETDGESVTDPNGVTVIVPTNDIQYFNESASEVYRPFETRPMIHRYASSYYTNMEYPILEKGDNWIQLESGRTTLIKYGSIEYPLNSDMMNDLEYAEKSFVSEGFVIDMPLGALDINPSRESLNYDDRTVQNLKFVIQRVVEEAKERVIPVIEQAMELELLPCMEKIIEEFDARKGTYSHKNFFKECIRKVMEDIDSTTIDAETKEKVRVITNWSYRGSITNWSYRGSVPNLLLGKSVISYETYYGDDVRLKTITEISMSSIFKGNFRLFYSSDPNLSVHKIRRLLRHHIKTNKDVRKVCFENDLSLFPGLNKEYIIDVCSLSLPKSKGTNSSDDSSRYSIQTLKTFEAISFNDLKDFVKENDYYWKEHDDKLTDEVLLGNHHMTEGVFGDSTYANDSELYKIAVKTKLIKNRPLIIINKRETYLKRISLIKDTGEFLPELFEKQITRFAKTHVRYLKRFKSLLEKNLCTQYFSSSYTSVEQMSEMLDIFGNENQLETKRFRQLVIVSGAKVAKLKEDRLYLNRESRLNKDQLFTTLMSKVPVQVLKNIVGITELETSNYLSKYSGEKDILAIIKKDLIDPRMIEMSSMYSRDGLYYVKRDMDYVKRTISNEKKKFKVDYLSSRILGSVRKIILTAGGNVEERILRLHIFEKITANITIIK